MANSKSLRHRIDSRLTNLCRSGAEDFIMMEEGADEIDVPDGRKKVHIKTKPNGANARKRYRTPYAC